MTCLGGLSLMTDCLVTGMTNVGKTCFVINFAEYMGLKELKLDIRQPAGFTSARSYSLVEARNQLVSTKKNFTREIQSVKMEVPVGKVYKELKIIDSCGLSEGIHPEEEIRLSMAHTIRLLRESNLIMHIIDLSNIKPEREEILLPIDKMIMDFASLEKNYVILANKIDLDFVKNNLKVLLEKYSTKKIIPISALYKQGFNEVKHLVLKNV